MYQRTSVPVSTISTLSVPPFSFDFRLCLLGHSTIIERMNSCSYLELEGANGPQDTTFLQQGGSLSCIGTILVLGLVY